MPFFTFMQNNSRQHKSFPRAVFPLKQQKGKWMRKKHPHGIKYRRKQISSHMMLAQKGNGDGLKLCEVQNSEVWAPKIFLASKMLHILVFHYTPVNQIICFSLRLPLLIVFGKIRAGLPERQWTSVERPPLQVNWASLVLFGSSANWCL